MHVLLLLLVLCPISYSFEIYENLRDSKLTERMAKMKAVKDRIMNGYDKLVMPEALKEDYLFGLNGTRVDTNLMPRQILDVDETTGLFVMDSELCLYWTDLRLKWNEVDYNGTLVFPQELLWLPDVYILNNRGQFPNPKSDSLLICDNNGYIKWCRSIVTQTPCPSLMEANNPYDEIQCNITFGSLTIDPELFFATWLESVELRNFLNIHQRWELLEDKVKVDLHVRNPEDYEEDMIRDLMFSFPVIRRSLPEVEVTFIPCLLVQLLTLSVFWLPPNSSKKLILLGFLFLILTVLTVYVGWNTSYSEVLLVTSSLQSTMCIVVITFFLQIFVIFNVCNLSGPSRPPSSLMKELRGVFGKFICLRCHLNGNNQPLAEIQDKEQNATPVDSPSPRNDWMLFAVFLDRLFFVFIFIVMIVIFHLFSL